jgi:hypothetical protein
VDGAVLVLLSRWKRTNALRCHGPIISFSNDGNAREEDLFHSDFVDEEWCTYDVMLVRTIDSGEHERVAIGQVHRDAYLAGGDRRDIILL